MEDYYDILEIQRGVPKKEIKKAFYRLAKKYHPDLNSDKNASSRFKRINEAYSVLVSERSRHEYDQKVEWNYANGDSSSFGFSASTKPMYNADGSPFYNIDEWYRSHYGPEVAERMLRQGFNADLSGWDTSGVTSMFFAFKDAYDFVGTGVENWNVEKMTSLQYAFDSALEFNADLSMWNVARVSEMSNAFSAASIFQGTGLENWNTISVTRMEEVFRDTPVFNADLSSWNVQKLSSLTGVFKNAKQFNGDITNWDVSRVTSFSNAFYRAESFNQDISVWSVYRVTDMFFSFYHTVAFDHDLSSWDVSNVIAGKFDYTFGGGIGLSSCNKRFIYDAWKLDNTEFASEYPSFGLEERCARTLKDMLENEYGTTCGYGTGSCTCTSFDAGHLSCTACGSIPSELGDCSDLLALNFRELTEMGALTGTIPSSLGNLSSLVTLDLGGGHSLFGSIPKELGLLKRLVTLDLSENDLTGSIPRELGDLESAVSISLSYNELNGSIPTQIGNLASLYNLELSGNELSGSLPTQIGALRALNTFRADRNEFTGTLPPEIGQLDQLAILELHRNDLNGTVNANVFANLSNMRYLHLAHNTLSGPVPSHAGMPHLEETYLYDNKFSVVPSDTFNGTVFLSSLNLANQRGGSLTLESGAFRGAGGTCVLALAGSKITSIPKYAFYGRHSSSIDLSNLEIERIDANAFAGTTNVKIDLRQNYVSVVSMSAFSDAASITGGNCVDVDQWSVTNQRSSSDACVGCNVGRYSNSMFGSTECTQCFPGRYTPDINATVCDVCDAGYATGTSVGATQCTICGAGTFSKEDKSAACSECPGGRVSSTPGKTSCDMCPNGTISNRRSSSDACIGCSVGRYSNGLFGSTECTQCMPGHYAAHVNASVCDVCDAGFSTGTSVGATQCTICGAGTFSKEDESTTCSECPGGRVSSTPGKTSCEMCPNGTISNQRMAGDACVGCNVGRYSNSMFGSTECALCLPGRYAAHANASACDVCVAGYATGVNVGATQCTECQPGSISAYDDSTACISCLRGTFAALPASTSCSECRAGTQSIERVGSSSCVGCPAGRYAAENGSASCAPCSLGTFAPVNASFCVACPPGKEAIFESGGGAVCEDLAAGFFGLGEMCTENQYSTGGATVCDECPRGKTSGAGASTCTDCDLIYMFSDHCELPVAGAAASLLGICLIVGVTYWSRRYFRKRLSKTENERDMSKAMLGKSLKDIQLMESAWRLDPSAIKLVERLAAGGFGEVWRGYLNGSIEVAVKKMFNSESVDLSMDSEIRFLQRARHPRLVMFIGCGRNKDTQDIFVVLEYMNHGDLSHLLYKKRAKSLPPPSWALRICLLGDVAEGMDFLHLTHRSIHRDLKTENCLLHISREGVIRAKVADFGLSRFANAEEGKNKVNENTPRSSKRQSAKKRKSKGRSRCSSNETKVSTLQDAIRQGGAATAPRPRVKTLSATSTSSSHKSFVSDKDCQGEGSPTTSRNISGGFEGMNIRRVTKRNTNASLVSIIDADDVVSPATNATMTSGIGTPVYMAPEICRNSAEIASRYDRKCDVYSFAIIMWESLALEVPWGEFDFSYKILDAVSNGRRPAVTAAMRGDAPDGFVEMMMTCWEQDPARRWEFDVILAEMRKMQDDAKVIDSDSDDAIALRSLQKIMSERALESARVSSDDRGGEESKEGGGGDEVLVEMLSL
eukprot:g673.t1